MIICRGVRSYRPIWFCPILGLWISLILLKLAPCQAVFRLHYIVIGEWICLRWNSLKLQWTIWGLRIKLHTWLLLGTCIYQPKSSGGVLGKYRLYQGHLRGWLVPLSIRQTIYSVILGKYCLLHISFLLDVTSQYLVHP